MSCYFVDSDQVPWRYPRNLWSVPLVSSLCCSRRTITCSRCPRFGHLKNIYWLEGACTARPRKICPILKLWGICLKNLWILRSSLVWGGMLMARLVYFEAKSIGCCRSRVYVRRSARSRRSQDSICRFWKSRFFLLGFRGSCKGECRLRRWGSSDWNLWRF